MDLSRAAYSRDLKIAAMRALDAGSATGEIARKYQLSPKLLERWRGEWRARGELAFPGRQPEGHPPEDDGSRAFKATGGGPSSSALARRVINVRKFRGAKAPRPVRHFWAAECSESPRPRRCIRARFRTMTSAQKQFAGPVRASSFFGTVGLFAVEES